jgi:hypothetical protein
VVKDGRQKEKKAGRKGKEARNEGKKKEGEKRRSVRIEEIKVAGILLQSHLCTI